MADGVERRAGLTASRPGVVAGLVVLALLAVLAVRARGESLPAEGLAPAFDQAMAAEVFTAALRFMGPRTLDPVGVPRMTAWGLRGITALDPTLVPVLDDVAVTLTGRGGVVAVLRLPAGDDVAGWGAMAASVTAAAWQQSEALRRAGTQGLISSFFDEVFNHLDPYSRYVAPAAAAADRARRRGTAGIGVALAGRPGGVSVAGVVADGPAARAGIRVGELVVAVDGRVVAGGRVAGGGEVPDAAGVLALLDGEEGSAVRLSVRPVRGGRGRGVRVVSLTRALVPENTVAARRDGGLLVLQVSGFTASTAGRLRHELTAALAGRPQPRGIVLDLRGNRGGLLREAVAAAGLVLAEGPIATTQGRDPAAAHVWTVADGDVAEGDGSGAVGAGVGVGGDLADGLPIVVLVDGRSASAAEVLAAALEDDGRAVVVGSATLGKGLVQTVAPMPDGGELFVTWSRVLAPAGWPLQGLGVMPQVCTSLGEQAMLTQLAALGMGSQPMAAVLRTHRAAQAGLPLAEMLTIRDACPAALGGDADVEAARLLIGNPIAYATALGPM